MPATLDLFPKSPRAKPRKLMHVVDAGNSGCCAPNGRSIEVVKFKCHRCGHETGWVEMASVSEAKRGIPCDRCNA